MSSIPSATGALRRLIQARLRDTQPAAGTSALIAGIPPDMQLLMQPYLPTAPVAAAVLVPIVDRADGLSVLLTQRSAHLKNHAGQVSFPGGRVEPDDTGPLSTALRETEEEIGLSRRHVELAGYLQPHLIMSGFRVTPVVGFVRPDFELRLNPREVDSTFEVPLAHVLDPANHRARERLLGDLKLRVYDIPYGQHHIWGATAGMLMALYHLLQ